MSFFHSHQIDIISLFEKRDGIKPLVYSTIIRTSSISLIGLFSGIYIYQNALELGFSDKNALLMIVLFYFIFALSKTIFLLLGERYGSKYGFKHTIRISVIPFVVAIPTLLFTEVYFWSIFLGGLFWGAHEGLFWWGYHGYFVKAQNSKSYGNAMGSTEFFYTVVVVLTPLIGAFLITVFGFAYVYLVSLILMLTSMYILGNDNDLLPKHRTSIKEIISDITVKPSEFLSLISRGVSFETHGIFWHLYLYLLFNTVLDLGIITSISVLIVSFVSIFIGKYNDRHGEKKSIYFGSTILSIAWIIRYLVITYPFIIFANALAALGGRTLHISIDEIVYKQADKGHTSEVLLFRELGLLVGMFVVLFSGFVIISLELSLSNLFIMAAALNVFPIIYAKRYE